MYRRYKKIDVKKLLMEMYPIGFDMLSNEEIENNISYYNSVMRRLKEISSYSIYNSNILRNSHCVNESVLKENFLRIESIIEKISAKNLLEHSEDDIFQEKISRHEPLMILDGKYLGIESNSIVAILGSGALPITGLILAKNFSCHVICIDMDNESLEISRKIVEKQGLISHFSFINANVLDLDFIKCDFSHIVMVAFLKQKDEIIDHIYKKGSNIKLLLRQPRGLYSCIYEVCNLCNFLDKYNILFEDAAFERDHYSSVIMEMR